MKFDTPAATNPIDQLRVVGQPLDRIDGPLKTTGRAPYAYERHDVVANQAYGHALGAGIAKGDHHRADGQSGAEGGELRIGEIAQGLRLDVSGAEAREQQAAKLLSPSAG
jgi:CO/xanthine dehydrogenase Mo-binding subunit